MSEAAEGQGRMQAQAQHQGQDQEQDQEQEQMADQAGNQQDRAPGQNSGADALQSPFGGELPEIAEPDSLAGNLPAGFGLRGRAVAVLACLGGLGALGLWSLIGHDQESEVKLAAVQAQSSRMRAVSPATSPDYRERLGTYSERRGNQALAQGGTFVAPQEGVHEPEPGDPALAPKVRQTPAPVAREQKVRDQPVRFEPQPPPPRPPVPRREALAQRRERGDSGLVSYLASLHREPGAPQTIVLHRPASARGMAGMASAASAGQASLPWAAQLAPGSLLYAVNRVALDSDAPGPAMAEVIAGPLKGARAMGGFQRHSGHLTLKFTSLALPAALGGQTLRIEAWAVDPKTERTAVRSAVDNHFIERWGGLLAASFLEGFGDAVSRAGISQSVTSYGAWQRWPRYDLEEQLAIGAGKLGAKAAGIFERNFSQPPTVTLDAGAELGILLLEVRQERTGLALGEALPGGGSSSAGAAPAAGAAGGRSGRAGDSDAPGRLRLAEQAGRQPFGTW